MDSWLALVAFLLVLSAPALVILTYLLCKRKVCTVQDFTFGKYDIHWLMVGLSIGTLTAAPLVLLFPWRLRGVAGGDVPPSSTTTSGLVGCVVAWIIVTLFHLPVLHYVKSFSLYEYFEHRFSSALLRYASLLIFLASAIGICVILLVSTAVFADAVFHIDRSLWVLILGLLAGLLSAVGGQRAVTCQASISFLLATLTLVSFTAIGLLIGSTQGTIFDISVLYVDATATFDYRNAVVHFLVCLYFLGCFQMSYQQVCSVRSVRLAHFSFVIGCLCCVVFWLLCAFVVILFWHLAFVAGANDCSDFALIDPLLFWPTKMFDLWGGNPIAYGLAVGSIASLTCSTLAVLQLSVSTSIWGDVVRNRMSNARSYEPLSTLRYVTLANAAAVTIVTATVVWLVQLDLLWHYFTVTTNVVCLFAAPIAALLTVAMTVPCINAKGAKAGSVCGIVACLLSLVAYLTYLPSPNGAVPAPPCRNTRNWTTASEDQPTETFSFNSSTSTEETNRNFSLVLTLDITPQLDNFSYADSSNDTFHMLDDVETCLNCTMEAASATLFQNLTRTNNTDDQRVVSPGPTPFLSLDWNIIICFVVTCAVTVAVSCCTGGQDIYAFDWNLVYSVCASCTTRMGSRKETLKVFDRSGTDVSSESFRYSHHGPYPDMNFSNPKVKTFLSTLPRLSTSK